MKRKLLSIVLALCLTLTLLPTMSVAAGSYRHQRSLGRKLHRTLERSWHHPGQQRSV